MEQEKNGKVNDKRGVYVSGEEYRNEVMAYRQRGYACLERIDTCLKAKTTDAVRELLAIFEEQEIEHYIYAVPELSYACLIQRIMLDEIRRKQIVQFILNGNSVKELAAVITRIKFVIWNVEFECGEEAEQNLYSVIEAYHVTPEAMSNSIMTAAMDKRWVYYILSCIYLEHHRMDFAIQLLELAQEEFPDDGKLRECLETMYGRRNSGKSAKTES